jgi:hypothetical protein
MFIEAPIPEYLQKIISDLYNRAWCYRKFNERSYNRTKATWLKLDNAHVVSLLEKRFYGRR